jgi:PD-(D/E)XK nuclease superfamily
MTELTLEEVKEIDLDWTTIEIDSQVLSAFMSCPAYFNYRFKRHLIPREGKSISIEKGTLAHDGLHAYWKARIEGKDYQEAVVDAIEHAKKQALKMETINPEDGLDVFKTLVEYFKFIVKLSWQPLFVEQHFRELIYENEKEKLRIYITGRIDIGMRTPQLELVPVDNKSESERWFHSSMRAQFKMYAIACGVNQLGIQRFGFQKTLAPEEKFKMEMISFDPSALEEFRTITIPFWVKRMIEHEKANFWPMNVTNCVHGHFKCMFSDAYNNGGICSASPELREQKLMRFFKEGEPWDPELV